ncbi:MAG: BTAD domain-containing putative transcriptional regulator [Solirubrobacteraceae bacterium]
MGGDVMTLRFGVLGPLEASWDGKPVRLGGDRQRALLALLLLHANQLVTMEQLVEQLFGADASDGAANAVHVAISRLRRVLHCGDGAVLQTRPGGYLLALDVAQLDATLFERLLDEGRELFCGGDPAAAAARLREALALWRGSPLADVPPLEIVAPEIRRLAELRVLALIERIDADLALGRDAELIPEIERLVASEPLRERPRAQLMLALYRSGRQAEALDVYRDASAALRDELGLEPGRALQQLERMVLQHDEELDAAPAGPAAPAGEAGLAGSARLAGPAGLAGPEGPAGRERRGPLVCPFKGLASFDSSDAEFFCGRERVVSDLVARLAEWTLVGILGPSGIGKSSLLRAGLLPALRAGALPASGGWRQVLVRPGEHPCDELARAFGDGGLGGALARLSAGERIVIAVDQLEELFTVCRRDDERQAFLAQLAAAARDHERRAFVVCALRADFYGRFGAYEAFAQLLSQSHVLVGPMDREQLSQAIELPAARAGLELDRALVDALVADVVHEPGGLPLLSTTLLELWLARDGRTLRFGSYRATGGVRGAVSRLAEAAYMQLGERQRPVACNLLLRLAGGEDGALVRRRVALTELERVDGAERVLSALTAARLLTVIDGEVELSHEALLREWPRYRAWLDEDRVGRRLHAHLTAAAGEWDARGRDAGDLYRGARLTAALDWVAQHREELNRIEREFIDCSRLQADREARRQRSQNRRLRFLLIGTGCLLFVSILAGVVALIKQHNATDDAHLAAAEARSALGRQLGAEAVNEPRIDVAMLLAREAVTLDRSPQTEGTLLSTLLRSPAVIGTFALPADAAPLLALSPDGETLAVADADADELHFYDAETHSVQRPPLSDFVGNQAPTYSADGSLLVYPAGAFLVVRDARTLALVAKLPFDAQFTQVQTAQSPDGSILISPDDSAVYDAYWLTNAAGQPAAAYVDRWSLPSARRMSTTRIGAGALLALRLVDAGKRLVVVATSGVRVYDARSLAPVASVDPASMPAQPSAAAISPDAATVVIGSQTGSVSFVDLTTGHVRRSLRAQTGSVTGVAYAPDGVTVVSFGDNNQIVVWDARAAAPATVLDGPLGQVENAAVSPDSATLYTASLGGVMLAWDLTGRQRFGRRSQLGPQRSCCDLISPRAPPLAVSPDGASFAVRLGPATVGVFSTDTLQRRASFTVGPADRAITALAWSPDGSQLAVAGHGGLAQLWTVSGAPRLVRQLRGLGPLAKQPDAIQAIAFSPDGRLIAASDDNETTSGQGTAAVPLATLAIWRAHSGALAASIDLGPGNGPGGSDVLAFSPNGKLLAVSLLHGGVRVLDTATYSLERQLSDPGNDIISLAFAPDGTLATGTIAGTVELWDPATGARLQPQPLLAASTPVTSIAFDATGDRLATSGDQDGTVKLWVTSSLQQEGPDLGTDAGATSATAFDPAGEQLVAVDDLGDAFTWPASLPAWEQRACAVAARNLTRAEWARFVGDLSYATVCR